MWKFDAENLKVVYVEHVQSIFPNIPLSIQVRMNINNRYLL